MHLDHDLNGGEAAHAHEHTHTHEELHALGIPHSHEHTSESAHAPMEELTALMQYMASHNAAHIRELADLAAGLDQAGNHAAYEQVMAAVSDFEKGNMRLDAVLSSLKG